jgi:hypothetical protein
MDVNRTFAVITFADREGVFRFIDELEAAGIEPVGGSLLGGILADLLYVVLSDDDRAEMSRRPSMKLAFELREK